MKKKKAAMGKIDKVEIIKEGWNEKEGFKMFTQRIISVLGIIGMIMLGMGCSAAASKPRVVQPVITTKSPVKLVEPILRIETGMHTALIRKIGIDAENRYLVTASYDKTVRVWEIPPNPPLSKGDEGGFRLIRTLRPPIGEGDEGKLYAVAISPDGKTIACGGWTGYEWEKTMVIYLFDRERGELIKRITGLPNVINHLTYSKDGRFLAATLGDKNGIRIYRTSGYSQIAEDKDYGSKSYGANFDINGRLVTTSWDGYIRLYDRNFRLITKKKSSGGNEPYSVSFSPDGSKIAVGFDSIKVDILSGSDLSYLYSPDTTGVDKGNLLGVTWSSDGRSLYAGREYDNGGSSILKWGNEGRGKYKEIITGADNTIFHILPLNPPSPPFTKGGNTLAPPLKKGDTGGFGGIVYAAVDPAFGIINERDERVVFKSHSIANYNSILEKFLISHDGSTVQFGYEASGKSPARFSVAERVLNTEIASASPRNDRGEGARNDRGEVLQPPLASASGLDITDWKNTNRPKLNGSPLKLRPYEFSRSLAISPDGNSFLLGAEWYLRLFDKYGFEKWIVPAPGAAWGVNISGNGKVAVAAFGDGTIRWYRMSDGKEILSFLPHKNKKDWVLWTPEGYFDTSEGADELIGWHINQGKDKEALFYPASRFFEQFYRPEIIVEVMKSGDTDEVVLARIGEKEKVSMKAGIKLPPRVSITSPREGEKFDKDNIEIAVMAEDMGGGIDEIRLFHNGKVVSEDMRGVKIMPKGNSHEKIFIVQLLEGDNRFKAIAFSKDRIESNPAEVKIELKGESKESNLYIVAVGINKYKNPALNLNYAEPDAIGIKSFFEAPSLKKLFKDVKIYTLFNNEATGKDILRLFDDIKGSARIQDTVVIYLAGHGDTVGSEWFFIPHDVATPEVEEDLKKGGISAKTITETMKGLKSQKVFVMIDACKSGSAVLAMRGFEDRKAILQLARSTGTYVISASTDSQFAAEVKELGHGVFTYALLEGLKGKTGDTKITVEGIIQYVKNRLPQLTEKYRGSVQYPISWGMGMDFPLVLY